MKSTSRLIPGYVALAIAAGCTLHATPARAWGGVFIGLPPVLIGPPAVAYPPPYAYPLPYYGPGYAYPPPAYPPRPPAAPAPQMSQAMPAYGGTCYAGVYTCAAPAQTYAGSGCSCPGLGAPSYGTAQ